MPLKQQDTDKLNTPPADVFGKNDKDGKKKKPADRDLPARDTQTNYGFSQGAELDTRGDETEEQEYAADGLPRTTKYSVDKH